MTLQRQSVRAPMPTTSSDWLELLRGIPGFDPFREAGERFVFDQQLATRAIDFFELELRHVKGPKRGQLLTLEPWQRSIVGQAFGWVDRETRLRRFRTVFLYVPRKNGKSPLLAGCGLYLLACDGEGGAEVYGIAGTAEQATIVYQHASGMVRQSRELSRVLKVLDSYRLIRFRETDSLYKCVPHDAGAAQGWNLHAALCDELHVWKTPEMLYAAETATAGRLQPMIIHATTADYDRPSACNSLRDRAVGVRDGMISDPRLLPVIYESTHDEDWTSADVWARVNPNLGVSVSAEYLEEQCERAKIDSAFENEFLRLHLNRKTEQAVRWVRLPEWDRCAAEPTSEPDEVCIGVDLSQTRDLTAVVAVWSDDGGETYNVEGKYWVPAETVIQKQHDDRVPYLGWQSQGLVEMTDGPMTDYRRIIKWIVDFCEGRKVHEIAIDPWKAQHVRTELEEEYGLPVVVFRQRYSEMSPALDTFDEMIGAGRLRHGGDPVLRWAASNVAVTKDTAGNLMPNKAKSYGRIDPFVALVMALQRASATAEEDVWIEGV